MAEVGSPIYKVAQALYELMPEQREGSSSLSDIPWHAASEETKARLFEAARIAIWTLRPVGDRVREAGQAVSGNAVLTWTAMIDAALDPRPDPEP